MSPSFPLTFVLLFCLSACTPTSPDTLPPNIIFIMSDDHTSQAWGLYGGVLQDYVKNKHIQRIAQEGALLKNVFCTNSICVPSRASIMTGQYSHQNGVYTLSEALEPDSNTIAKVLQEAGYETAIIGKWHLKKEPSGFDHYMVLPGQGVYHNPILKTAENWQDRNKGGKEYKGFSADVIGDFSIDWLKNRKGEQPFFLMCHFKSTHEPFDYPERYEDFLADDTIPEPTSLYDFGPQTNGRVFAGHQLETLLGRWQRYSQDSSTYARYPGLPFSVEENLDATETRKATYQKFIKDYLRCAAAIDDNIGKLLDYLESSGLDENTVIIYTSDQGYFLGEHGFFDKRMIYEEALRMPFVMRYPKEIEAGTVLDDIVLNIDFPALFADYANLEKPAFIRGRSFRENLKGNSPADWRRSMYYRYWLHLDIRPGHFGIRTDRYKLAFFYGQPLGMPGAMDVPTEPGWEFYDLQKDPGEDRNAYHDPAYAATIADLKQQLWQLREEWGDTDTPYPQMQAILDQYWD